MPPKKGPSFGGNIPAPWFASGYDIDISHPLALKHQSLNIIIIDIALDIATKGDDGTSYKHFNLSYRPDSTEVEARLFRHRMDIETGTQKLKKKLRGLSGMPREKWIEQ